MEILRIENLNFKYPNAQDYALSDISLSVESGQPIVLYGMSGCGKTTLLKMLKKELRPAGQMSGSITFCDEDLNSLSSEQSARRIGFLMQNPDSQIVTDKVINELAFGLESIGTPADEIERRIAETANYFGIHQLMHEDIDRLSGGQKQLVCLASLVAMQPDILLLDEPTARLDPIAATKFISIIEKLNRELGITVIIAEHRIEDIFAFAHKAVIMQKGKIIACDAPKKAIKSIDSASLMEGLPCAARVFIETGGEGECPLSIGEGRNYLKANFKGFALDEKTAKPIDPIVELKNVWFRYAKKSNDVMKGASLSVGRGECFFLLGGNGSGKSTTLNVIAGLEKPYQGKVIIDKKDIKKLSDKELYSGKIAYLPQDSLTVFTTERVIDDIKQILLIREPDRSKWDDLINKVAEQFNISHLLERHPYDLSGGEQQLCALAKLMVCTPSILMLDEPARSLDAWSKSRLGKMIRRLCDDGVTVIAVTHDTDFASQYGDRCAMFFDGRVSAADTPQRFFAQNRFYTTAACRMARDTYPNAVTAHDVIDCCKKEHSL